MGGRVVVHRRLGRYTRIAAAAPVCALLIFSVVVLRAAAEPTTSGSLPPGITAEDIPGDEANRLAGEAYQKKREADQAREKVLEGPAATQERAASRDAFRSQDSPAEAGALLRQRFGPELAALDEDPARALEALTFERFLSDDVAVVTENGAPQVLDSPIPLRTQNDDGELAPLDLTLRSAGKGFTTANGLVDTALPGESGGEVSLGSELSFSVDVPGEKQETAAGQPFGTQSLIYASGAGTDSDLILAAVSGGVDVLTQIRSPDSPDNYDLNLDLPPKSTLALQADGSVAIEQAGTRLGQILAPRATDAQGQDVPTHLTVDGETVSVTTEFKGGDYALPILTDPVVDVFNWASGSAANGWAFAAENQGNTGNCSFNCPGNPPCLFSWGFYYGMVAYAPGGCAYRNSTWGQWLYYPPGPSTFITKATFNPISYTDSCNVSANVQAEPHGYVGVFRRSATQGWRSLLTFGPPVSGASKSAVPALPDLTSPQDVAVAGLGTPQIPGNISYTSICQRTLFFQGASISMSDPDNPEVGTLTHSGIGTETNGWTDSTASASVSFRASDGGLGVFGTGVYYPKQGGNVGGTHQLVVGPPTNCTATPSSPCKNDYPGPSDPPVTISYPLADFPEGVTSAEAWAWDPLLWQADDNWWGVVPHLGTKEFPVRVDRTAPTLTLSGNIKDDSLPGVDLHIHAEDGDSASAATARSGVRDISVLYYADPDDLTNPETLYHETLRCIGSDSSCPDDVVRDLQLPFAKVLGEHTYEVRVEDQLGHSVSEQWTEVTPEDPSDPAQATVGRLSDGDVDSGGEEASGSSRAPQNQCPGPNGGPRHDGFLEPGLRRLKGGHLIGTRCNDRIVASKFRRAVTSISGGDGDDQIFSGGGTQTIHGDDGNDTIFSERSSDHLFGDGGADRLYGGIGDEDLHGGAGNDLLVGNLGADLLDGGQGDDVLRPGATNDQEIYGGDGAGQDTLDLSDAVTPGFAGPLPPEDAGQTGFPPAPEGRGVLVDLTDDAVTEVDNGATPEMGGGPDRRIVAASFERIIGSPFSDVIFGNDADNVIAGGGGADIIHGEGGDDVLLGGPDGDFLDGGSGSNELDGQDGSDGCINPTPAPPPPGVDGACESSDEVLVPPRDPETKLSVGLLDYSPTDAHPVSSRSQTNIYLVGSMEADHVDIRKTATHVNFSVVNGPGGGRFPIAQTFLNGCQILNPRNATCPATGGVDTLVLAGMDGRPAHDQLSASNFDPSTSVELLGGDGPDDLTGGLRSEDLMVDGSGNDTMNGAGKDDGFLQNQGTDKVYGGAGNDLLVSTAICEGNVINGGVGATQSARFVDSASFAQFRGPEEGVFVDLGKAGQPNAGEHTLGNGNDGPPGHPGCGSANNWDSILNIEDLEGSSNVGSPIAGNDVLIGDATANILLGRGGPDYIYGGAGRDRLLANNFDVDRVLNCGDDFDRLKVDRSFADPPDMGCEKRRRVKGANPRLEGPAATGQETLDEMVIGGWDEGDDADSSPTALYRLNETSGQSAVDWVAGNDAAYRTSPAGGAGPALGLPGVFIDDDGTAVSLDGGDDQIELGTIPDPGDPAAEGFSVEMWVKFHSNPGDTQYLFSQLGTGPELGNALSLYRDSLGRIVFETDRRGGQAARLSSDDAASTGAWHHIVATINASDPQNNRLDLYLDGFGYSLGTGSQPILPGTLSTAPAFVGVSSSGSGHLDADLDEVALYDSALPYGEVRQDLGISTAVPSEVQLLSPTSPFDEDEDGLPDDGDNCPANANPDQADENQDGVGDACEEHDDDGDGVPNESDNCIYIANIEQADSDGNGVGDVCEPAT